MLVVFVRVDDLVLVVVVAVVDPVAAVVSAVPPLADFPVVGCAAAGFLAAGFLVVGFLVVGAVGVLVAGGVGFPVAGGAGFLVAGFLVAGSDPDGAADPEDAVVLEVAVVFVDGRRVARGGLSGVVGATSADALTSPPDGEVPGRR